MPSNVAESDFFRLLNLKIEPVPCETAIEVWNELCYRVASNKMIGSSHEVTFWRVSGVQTARQLTVLALRGDTALHTPVGVARSASSISNLSQGYRGAAFGLRWSTFDSRSGFRLPLYQPKLLNLNRNKQILSNQGVHPQRKPAKQGKVREFSPGSEAKSDLKVAVWLKEFCTSEALKRGSARGDRDMRINSIIASTRKALNWSAKCYKNILFSSTIALNGERYLHFLQDLLPEYLEDVPLATRAGVYLQQAGAPAHSTRPVVQNLPQLERIAREAVWARTCGRKGGSRCRFLLHPRPTAVMLPRWAACEGPARSLVGEGGCSGTPGRVANVEIFSPDRLWRQWEKDGLRKKRREESGRWRNFFRASPVLYRRCAVSVRPPPPLLPTPPSFQRLRLALAVDVTGQDHLAVRAASRARWVGGERAACVWMRELRDVIPGSQRQCRAGARCCHVSPRLLVCLAAGHIALPRSFIPVANAEPRASLRLARGLRLLLARCMEQRLNARAGEMGDSRENPPISGIVRHDSHLRKYGVNRPGLDPVRLGGRRAVSNRSYTVLPVLYALVECVTSNIMINPHLPIYSPIIVAAVVWWLAYLPPT
ncbi:hypothetical protein PR048_026346 [Dryococelus australis]|uniref:Uncharacterized protein n=1 Tax=Dryococelus australis TaxID=614101 RepID=A0ABQ9GL29_9NEOP|nr:hypothetical protein PR048_026346 [Dryococelus australis]